MYTLLYDQIRIAAAENTNVINYVWRQFVFVAAYHLLCYKIHMYSLKSLSWIGVIWCCSVRALGSCFSQCVLDHYYLKMKFNSNLSNPLMMNLIYQLTVQSQTVKIKLTFTMLHSINTTAKTPDDSRKTWFSIISA